MPLPISRTQLDKLGDRLAAESASSADIELLEQVLAAYDEIISRALEIIEPLGYRPTSRLKTSGTLIEKLQREHGMKLKGVQDIAGLRIVLSRDQDQDEVVAQLVEELERSTEAAVRVVDRRANPSHGYRAVHLVAKIDNLPVEVQVRTFLQDEWAQLFESLADRWGRQIRYGKEPDRGLGGEAPSENPRAAIVELMRNEASIAIASAEQSIQNVARLRLRTLEIGPKDPDYQEVLDGVDELQRSQPALVDDLIELLRGTARIADGVDGIRP